MKLPLEIFTLTKREQRIIVVIVMALLAGAVAKHYHDTKSHVPLSAPATPDGMAPLLSPSPPEDEQASLEESP
jgi:hypothetical protein